MKQINEFYDDLEDMLKDKQEEQSAEVALETLGQELKKLQGQNEQLLREKYDELLKANLEVEARELKTDPTDR